MTSKKLAYVETSGSFCPWRFDRMVIRWLFPLSISRPILLKENVLIASACDISTYLLKMSHCKELKVFDKYVIFKILFWMLHYHSSFRSFNVIYFNIVLVVKLVFRVSILFILSHKVSEAAKRVRGSKDGRRQ